MRKLTLSLTITLVILVLGMLTFPFVPMVSESLIPRSGTLFAMVAGFLYIILLPGYLLDFILKASPRSSSPYVRFASIIGLGTGFSELSGLIAYYISRGLHIRFNSGYLAVSTIILSILLVLHIKHHEALGVVDDSPKEEKNPVGNGIVAFVILSLGIAGAYLVTTKNLYYVLLLDYLIIITVLLTKEKIKLFSGLSSPFLLWTAALTLLYTTSLSISWRNLQGWDIFGELYVAKNVYLQGSLHITFKDYVLNTYLSSLSVSLLPFVFKAVGSVPISMLFKVIYPFIFSLTAPVLYTLYHEVSDSEKMALFATILNIVFYQYFLFNLQLVRLMIGAFYYVLFLYFFINTLYNIKAKIITFLWAFLTIVNYYTIGYLLLIQLIFLMIWEYIPMFDRSKIFTKHTLINIKNTILILLGIFLIWYGYYFVGATWKRIILNIFKFLVAQQTIHSHSGISIAWIRSIRNVILISILGFSTLGLLLNLIQYSNKNLHKLNHPLFVGMGFFWAGLSAMVYLFPRVALTLNAPRVYSLSMFVLGIYSIWGLYFASRAITSRIFKNPRRIKSITDALVILYILLYFVSSTGIFGVITNNHSFPPPVQFDRRIDWPKGTEEEMTVGMWMEQHQNVDCKIYGDEFRIKFMPYTGNRKMINKNLLPNKFITSSCGYLFLGRYNLKHRELLIYVPKPKTRYYWPLPEFTQLNNSIIHSTESTKMLYWGELR